MKFRFFRNFKMKFHYFFLILYHIFFVILGQKKFGPFQKWRVQSNQIVNFHFLFIS